MYVLLQTSMLLPPPPPPRAAGVGRFRPAALRRDTAQVTVAGRWRWGVGRENQSLLWGFQQKLWSIRFGSKWRQTGSAGTDPDSLNFKYWGFCRRFDSRADSCDLHLIRAAAMVILDGLAWIPSEPTTGAPVQLAEGFLPRLWALALLFLG